jgi:hypothetical protein
MPSQESHLSNQELLLFIDGELASRDSLRVHSHLTGCWSCRTRKQEIEAAITEFTLTHRRNFDMQMPPPDGPRALLKIELARRAQTQRTSWLYWFRVRSWRMLWATCAAAFGLGAIAYFISHPWSEQQTRHMTAVTTPNPSLTPGAAVLRSQVEICRAANINNKEVPVALQRLVFNEYGIPTAEPSAYEVDYLITPALGGADDIHNLWPESSRETVWNSQVKDTLEARLRDMVCNGQLDLTTAQREIATNWIQAYKKYFHTDRPLNTFR